MERKEAFNAWIKMDNSGDVRVKKWFFQVCKRFKAIYWLHCGLILHESTFHIGTNDVWHLVYHCYIWIFHSSLTLFLIAITAVLFLLWRLDLSRKTVGISWSDLPTQLLSSKESRIQNILFVRKGDFGFVLKANMQAVFLMYCVKTFSR